ncbi:hypothetical protein ACTVZO_41980 [Streptomyces sp. IBSNAI002]|uniref:hypothetical protein n=1 Tax=Streptomyces sp. IBSNAI002 TaxID=3457500 RepID=UPI003FD01374
MTWTRERRTAAGAVFAAVVVAFLLLHTGAGLGSMGGAGILTYAGIVIAVAARMKLDLFTILRATGKGSIVVSVVTVLVFIGFWRAIKGA